MTPKRVETHRFRTTALEIESVWEGWSSAYCMEKVQIGHQKS